MKTARVLVIIMVIGILVSGLAGCKDPLKTKLDELDKAYAKMGDTYWNAIYWTSIAGVYGDTENYEEMNAKFDEWKFNLQDAGDVIDTKLDLKEDEIDKYITDWNAITEEIQKVIDEYEVESETETEEEESEEAAA